MEGGGGGGGGKGEKGRKENEWAGEDREGEKERDIGRRKRGLNAITVTQVYLKNRFTIHTQNKKTTTP